MTILSVPELPFESKVEFTIARIQDVAFDAVRALWKRRQKEGMTLQQLAERIPGGDKGRLSNTLKGPSNLTLKTLAKLVAALGGEARIEIVALEDKKRFDNGDLYAEFEDDAVRKIEPKKRWSESGTPSIRLQLEPA